MWINGNFRISAEDTNAFKAFETTQVEGVNDVCELAKMMARAANGANFNVEGCIERSCGDEMNFIVDFSEGKLVVRHSDWYCGYGREMVEDYETYEEYCADMIGDLVSEENFKKIKENDFVYEIDSKIFLELPIDNVIELEY